jgi:hypothetical protein
MENALILVRRCPRQTFALEVLDILHAWNPNMVPASCLELAQRNAFVLGRHTTKARAIRGPRPVFASEAQEQVPAETRAWIASTASQLPPRTVPLADRTMRTPFSGAVPGRTEHRSDPVPVQTRRVQPERRMTCSEPRPVVGTMPGAWIE